MAKMTMKTLAELLEQVQAQITALSARIEQLEMASAPKPIAEEKAPPAPTKEVAPVRLPAPAQAPITEEELIAISAALAAYLGVRVHIKKIRLLGSESWAQQGRVWIQASHNLHQ